MTARDTGFTQGVGCAIHYVMKEAGASVAERLFQEMGMPLSDYEEVCEEYDLEFVRKAAQ